MDRTTDAILLPYQARTAAGVWDLPQSHTLAILYPDYYCRTGPIHLTDMGRVWHGVCFSL